MRKTFCDRCGSEISSANEARGVLSNISVSLVNHKIVSESDVCKHCVIDAVKKLDDRDRIVQEQPAKRRKAK